MHMHHYPDGSVLELPAGTKILPDEIFRLLQQPRKQSGDEEDRTHGYVEPPD